MFDGRQRFRALERRVQLLGEDSVQLLAWVLVFSDGEHQTFGSREFSLLILSPRSHRVI
jgi:hypothetical protein